MRGLIFLPDREGVDHLTSGAGLARMEGSADSALQALSRRLAVREDAAAADEAAIHAWRGALALALLADVWRGSGLRVSILEVDENTSAFAAMIMAASMLREQPGPIRLVLLEKEGERRVLGVASARRGMTPAANPGNLSAVLPDRVTWYDRTAGKFLNPVPLMNERDRALLIRRLRLSGLKDAQVSAFVSDLAQESLRESQALGHGAAAEKAELALRARIAFGLEGEGFTALTVRQEEYAPSAGNALLQVFTKKDDQKDEGLGAQRTWLWQGIPFARASTVTALTATNHPRERYALELASAEIARLEEDSPRWQRDAAQRLLRAADAHERSRAFLPAAGECLREQSAALTELAQQPPHVAALTWPWDEQSDAIRLLLRENLGPAFDFVGSPFSERLARLKGGAGALGDRLLQASCRVGEDAFLPPLSQALAACLYSAPEGQGLSTEQVYLLPDMDGSVTATFLLRGTRELALVRRYEAEEITVLQETPAVAVWPCIPFAENPWRAYFLYLRGEGIGLQTYSEGRWLSAETDEKGYAVLEAAEYPACVTLHQGGVCLGAVPNILPRVQPSSAPDAVVALDVGASGTAVVIRQGEEMLPLEGDCLLRTLLDGGAAERYEEEFLPAKEIGALWPTCAALSGEGTSLLADGRIYEPSTLDKVAASQQTLLSGSLKWRSDDAARRGRELLLHQTMLTASLVCRLRGATGVTWRLALPDGTGPASRQGWLDMVEVLAGIVARETGLPLSEGLAPVGWMQESAALARQLRESVTGGSFAALDLGGGSTGIHLWLPASDKPAAGCTLHGGMQALLLGSLGDCPDMLTESLSGCGDEQLLADAAAVVQQLRRARGGLQQMDRALLMMDQLLQKHAGAVSAHMNNTYLQGKMTHLQALLLEHYAAVLLVTGLVLEQAAENPEESRRLPRELTLCLSGRGSLLFSALPAGLKNGMARFVRVVMREEHPVQSLLLFQSMEPKLDVCRGLCRHLSLPSQSWADQPPEPIGVSSSFAGLVMRFLLVLRAAYPMVCQRLHPGMFSDQGLLSVEGEDAVRQAAARHFDEGRDIPGAFMATLSELRSAVRTQL